MGVSQQLGSRYVLEEPLGRGATGTVWRGRVRDSDEAVAVKVLREELAGDPDVVTRFLRERALLLQLRHPNLVGVRDLVVEGDVLALVMELIDGPDLRTYLRQEGPFEPAEAARLLAEVTDALAATHASGIVHRDLKPGNILLRGEGGSLQPLLTDFGIARLADGPQLTRTHEFLGTPQYVAPETVRGGTPTGAADLYAAGIVLYELVTGKPPFVDDSPFVVMRKHVEDTPRRPAGMPDLLWLVTIDCLNKDPKQRPDAQDAGRRLRRAADLIEGVTLQVHRPTGDDSPTRRETVQPHAAPPVGPAATKSFDALRTQQVQAQQAQAQQAQAQPPAASPNAAPQPAAWPAFRDNQPTLVDSTPASAPQAPPRARQAPPRARQTPNAWQPPPAWQAPPPAPAPRPAPTRQPKRRRQPSIGQPPSQAPAPVKQRRQRGRRRRIPGMGCLLRLVILFVVLAAAYNYVSGTPVGQLLRTVFTDGPVLVQTFLDKVGAALNGL